MQLFQFACFFNVVLFQIYFGCNAGHYHIALHALGVNCFTGMSYLVDKRQLDEMEGLVWFGQYLAEDFFLAKLLSDRLVYCEPN